MILSFIRPPFLLRRPFKLRTLLLPPIRSALRWTKLTPKSSAKLVLKPITPSKVPSILPPPAKLPPPPRRKRVRFLGGATIPKPRTMIRFPTPAPADPWQGVSTSVTPQQHRTTTRVLALSVTEVYNATRRMLAGTSRQDITDEDRAILAKLRAASFRHEFIAGVKATEEQLRNVDAEENRRGIALHDAEAMRLRAQLAKQLEQKQVEEDTGRARWQALSDKRRMVAFTRAALRGHKPRINTSLRYIARWRWYEAFWQAIETAQIEGFVPFNQLPWPTLNPNQLQLADYEVFVLSPARPRFETTYWHDRLSHERKHWNADNVRRKVVPLCDEDIRDRVINCARVLCEFLDSLVYKYTNCEEEDGTGSHFGTAAFRATQ
ncbi:hypothetical protein V5O48_005265 [Marasmius crinis-equi]|uniref:Uncharacterized protein n=1 Tax=Marasmius crinis-equi TaxID=585013 RepID=A0ABR3FMS0_9AGAR